MKQILNSIPDLLLFSSITFGFILNRFFPIVTILDYPLNLVGCVFILLGIIFALYTIKFLRLNRTSTNVTQKPSKLLITGPFSISRNPLYLAYLITIAGVSILFGSLAVLILPIIAFLILNLIVIPIEEKDAQATFNKEYIVYKNTTRKWL